jgi:hypothetical protein
MTPAPHPSPDLERIYRQRFSGMLEYRDAREPVWWSSSSSQSFTYFGAKAAF